MKKPEEPPPEVPAALRASRGGLVTLPFSGPHGLLIPVNWHQVIDERNYEMDQVIASELRRDPSKLGLVVEWIEKRLADPGFSIHSKDALKEWLNVIQSRGTSGVLEVLAERGEEAARLRQNSPFAIIMPQGERMKILSSYESLRPRARPAGS